MLPKVIKTENVEMIRDGGSFAATFSDVSGHRYILFFPIKHGERGEFLEPRQHTVPVIIDCDPSKRPANTDGVFYSELGGPATPISWESARSLLSDIAAKRPENDSPRRSLFFEEWLREMIGVASREGAPTAVP